MKRLSAVVSEEEYARVERLVKTGAAESVAQLVREAELEVAGDLFLVGIEARVLVKHTRQIAESSLFF